MVTGICSEAAVLRWFSSVLKKVFSKIRNNYRKQPVWESPFNKAEGLKGYNFINRRSNTGVVREYCEIFKNNFFYRTPP